jgi:peptidoglycan/LPS O-acetylase OafA/YrhL
MRNGAGVTTIDSGDRRGRSDIQALRGYAVLLVILYHTNLGLVPLGFLGVDIFFVISGYLITGIIVRGLRAGTFGFQDFYLRRVRRPFPAAFVTLALTLIGSVFLLTSSAWHNFAPQLYGALFFTTNIVLWQQINYFKSAAELEPLLHMWSLAVEEQYYLVLPVVLSVVPQRLWRATIATITLGSLGGYIWLYPHSSGAAFYLLPTRAWEIGIGAIVTFMPPLRKPARAPRRSGRRTRWRSHTDAVRRDAVGCIARKRLRCTGDVLAVQPREIGPAKHLAPAPRPCAIDRAEQKHGFGRICRGRGHAKPLGRGARSRAQHSGCLYVACR